MSHTEGKLKITGKWIRSEGGHEVAYFGLPDMDEADARRLVACWNACVGIPTDAIESGSLGDLFNSLSQKTDDVRRERNELLKALRSARNYLDEQYPMIDASELLDEEIDPILARHPEGKS